MSVSITIVGTGYVGLVTGTCFAELGHDVICVDKANEKIALLRDGGIPIYEPGLEELVKRNVKAGRLRFSTDLDVSVAGREAVFIAVGTPTKEGSNEADLSYVHLAAQEVARAIVGFTVVVSKSTVPVGTNRNVLEICKANLKPGAQAAVASNPEFLREGAAINDFMHPDRIVVGVDDQRALGVMQRIYAPLTVNSNTPLVITTTESAELIKYAANALLAVKISFINEISNLCEALDANIVDVSTGVGLDHRIGSRFLNTGPGWGGSCFPKDTRALAATASSYNVESLIVTSAINANENRKHHMIQKITAACEGSVRGKRIGVLGLTFKGQTDDMRESASLVILPALVEGGAEVIAFDPASPRDAAKLLPGISVADNYVDVATDADLLVVLTDWIEFKTYDLSQMASVMRNRNLLDLRNIFSPDDAISAGFTSYKGLGIRGITKPQLLATTNK